MEKLLNVENDWDGEVDCPEVMGPRCLISEEEVAAAIKGLKIGKAAGPTGVVSEMMKAAGGFGSRWMTHLINNIVKEGCIPDDWRKSILVPVYKGKGDPLVFDPGMSLNCAPTRVCRKSASRPGYVVKVRTDHGYVVKQCPRIVMNKIFDWH